MELIKMSNPCFSTLLHAKSEAEQPLISCQAKFKMRDCRLSHEYASLIFKYCNEHPNFTIKHFDASDAIARRGYRF